MRTQVGIIGAGPAGLFLAHALARRGIDSTVLEARSRASVESRVRAGVLEGATVDLLREAGLAERVDREAVVHDGISLRVDGEDHRLDLVDLVGRGTVVHEQQELVTDLVAAALAAGVDIRFGVSAVAVDGAATDHPVIGFTDADGTARDLRCAAVAGCDGFDGVARRAVGGEAHEVRYPYAWLGVLADTTPAQHEWVFARHPRGFARYSRRGSDQARLYLQVPPDTDVREWSDGRIWDELGVRLAADGFGLGEGAVLDRRVTGMPSAVVGSMRRGRLFLAGDAGHVVPCTVSRGCNLALADAADLAAALAALLRDGDSSGVDGYSDSALRRAWRAEQFSWSATTMLHVSGDPVEDELRSVQLRHTVASRAASTALAERYVGV